MKPLSHPHRATRRPIRPKPLIPILIFFLLPLDSDVETGGRSATTARVCSTLALRAIGAAALLCSRSGVPAREECSRNAWGLTRPAESFDDGANHRLPAPHRRFDSLNT